MSNKDSLSKEDIKKWAKEVFIFCIIPSIIAFLQAIQTGDFKIALGATEATLIAALINLFRKYSAGVEK